MIVMTKKNPINKAEQIKMDLIFNLNCFLCIISFIKF